MTDAKLSVFDDTDHYPGLTLAQPYAGAVLLAAQGYPGKTIETRKVRFRHVGADVVICAGLDQWADDFALVWSDLERGRTPAPVIRAAIRQRGSAIALVKVVEDRPLVADDYERSLWWDAAENARKPRRAWVLGDMRPIRPFWWRGCQGFSRVPRKLVEVLHAHA